MRIVMRSAYVAHRKNKLVQVRATAKRKGYTYMAKGGSVHVKAVPIKDVGAAGKGPKIIGKLKAGMLTQYHYHPVETRTARHRALIRAVRVGQEDPHQIIKRLIAISTLTKRTLPNASRIYKSDARWVHEKFSKYFKSK